MKISIIGAGSWGTTLAVLLGEKGFNVKIWARREELANGISSKRENIQYLPGIKVPDNIIINHSLKDVLEGFHLENDLRFKYMVSQSEGRLNFELTLK